MLLNAERATAAATPGGVRIVELETGTVQTFNVIDFGAIHVQQARLINEHFQSVEFKAGVTLVVEVLVKPHTIGETRATAANNLDTQSGVRLRLFRQNFLHFIFSLLRQHDCHMKYLPNLLSFVPRCSGAKPGFRLRFPSPESESTARAGRPVRP